MKKIIIALMVATMLFTSGAANSIQANGWRLNITSSIDEETPVVVTEVEFLDDSTVPVDVSQSDIGISDCGWTCDSVLSNQIGDSAVVFVANPKRNRKIGVAFDNNLSSYYTTTYKIVGKPGNFYVQYSIYRGATTPPRTNRNIKSYSVSVPDEDIKTGAPGGWTLEYLSSTSNSWELAHTRRPDSTDINWNTSGRVYEVAVGSTTFYLVDSKGTRSMVFGTDSDWSAPLTGTALTDATTAISDDGILVARRLEFDL